MGLFISSDGLLNDPVIFISSSCLDKVSQATCPASMSGTILGHMRPFTRGSTPLWSSVILHVLQETEPRYSSSLPSPPPPESPQVPVSMLQ